MHIRPIEASDNKLLAVAIRSVLIEMGVPKVGTAYADVELDAMFETYLDERAIYYVVYEGENILGGAGWKGMALLKLLLWSPLTIFATTILE